MKPPTLEEAFTAVQKLAEDFKANQGHFLSPSYQESEVRTDFINKFLIALGWDVNHDWQKNPFEQEVKVETGVNMQGARKRADYAFFIGPNFRDVRFFVEAKRPAGDIATAQNYFQTIRYGWNAQTPVAVLTDFEQFQILDCRYKPDVDTALSYCIQKFHYSEYADQEKFAVIYHLFSHDAVANGSLDKFAAELPKKRGKAVQRGLFKGGWQSIDEAFLEELDGYRDVLARSFKNKNPALDGNALTEITQRTIDRLVFIRFLEDKMIHPENLISEFGNKGTAWKDFIAASRKLDNIYNSIVFRKHDILDALGFKVDDGKFAYICEKLAHVNSPYDFNSIPIHILGSIYERFLGKVIVTTAKRATLEEKPEVRKAGGVYYTPEYIVRYITENTVGKQIKGKSPAQIAEMRFADIACGSGSFLLGVFDLLLSYHSKWFNANPDKAKKAGCVWGEDGAWHLSLKQRREILVNNIYGVDIDNQAVEVAQLSLYLKLLEEETTASTRQHQMEFHETILPSLNKNIVCGNSLIGRDIETGKLFAGEEERKLNPMDYEQRFPEIMKRGFHAIVGNPPYGAYLDEIGKNYLYEKYPHQSYQLDSYLLFLEKAVSHLLAVDGYFGMIIPNPWLTNLLQDKIRMFIVSNTRVKEIIHFRFPVFPKVTVDTEIVILQKSEPKSHKARVTIVEALDTFRGLSKTSTVKTLIHDQAKWRKLNGAAINIFLNENEESLAAKLVKQAKPLGSLCEINVGIKPYQVGKGKPRQTKEIVETRPFDSDRKASKQHRPYLRGRDINRYLIAPLESRFLKYGPWLAEPRPAANFDAPVKLFMRQTGDSLIGTLDTEQFLCLNNMHVLVPFSSKPPPVFLLGVINSRLLNWYYRTLNPEVGEALAEVKKTNVAKLPIVNIDVSKEIDKVRHDRMVVLVEQMLAAKKQLATAQSDKDKDFYSHRCESTDRQIDRFVYELYGLTEDEIKIVEGK